MLIFIFFAGGDYLEISADADSLKIEEEMPAGTRFTCFTSTKVQMLTSEESRGEAAGCTYF